MSKPPRICPCNVITPHGELCACQQKAQRDRKARYDANRPPARDRGYDHQWRKARAEYLALHPHCRECAKSGITRRATVVDHIIRHRRDKNLFWHRANWQPLCKPCHDSVKQRQERAL